MALKWEVCVRILKIYAILGLLFSSLNFYENAVPLTIKDSDGYEQDPFGPWDT